MNLDSEGNKMTPQNHTGKAALFMGPGKPFEVREFPVSAPEKGKALLRILASGICGTDVHIRRGRLAQPSPLIIGHEFIGEIAALSAETEEFRVGDRVLYNMAKPCGKCRLCKTGDSANCLSFEVAYARDPAQPPHFFGGYADWCYAPADASSLTRLPDGVETVTAALFPCAGPTVLHALRLGGVLQKKADGVETAVVQGAGPLGQFASFWLSLCGVPRILLAVRDPAGPRAAMIAKLTRAQPVSPGELGGMISEGLSADLCIECSGVPEAFETGCRVLRNRGVYLVPGQYSDSGTIPFGPQVITFKALQIIGSSQYDASDVREYIRFLREHSAGLSGFAACSRGFPVDRINEAMDAAESHRYSKVYLTRSE